MNKIFLIGNLGKDPKVHKTEEKQVAFLSVATNENWIKNGEKQQHTDWHDVVIFREQDISFVSKYLKKGDQVLIEGKLKHRLVANDDGTNTKVSEVVIANGCGGVKSLSSKESREEEVSSSASKEPSKNTEQNTKKLEEMGYVLEPVTDFGLGYKTKEEEEIF